MNIVQHQLELNNIEMFDVRRGKAGIAWSQILSLNIRHGGGERAALLVNWFKSRNPLAIVIAEWRNNLSGQLIGNALAADGFDVSAASRGARDNSVLFAAKGAMGSKYVTPNDAPAGELYCESSSSLILYPIELLRS